MPEGEKHRERAADKRFDSSAPKGSHRSGIYGRSSAVKGISLPGPCPFDLGVAESYVQFMRGLRRYTIALLVAAVAVAVVASSATAEYRDHDPDDTATSFDIRSVSSNVLPNGHLLFRSTFYDVLQWNANSHVWVYIDSRAGASYDFLLEAGVRHDVATCYFYSRKSLIGPVGVRVGPRRVTCTVARRFLRSTHVIRWKVRALSRDGTDVVSDWAPGGSSNWYPHV